MTKLYVADVECLQDPEIFDAAYAAVSTFRQCKIDAMRFSEGKRLSLGAELILKIALREAGIDASELLFDVSLKGKPFLKNQGGINFNLSHSGSKVCCAISRSEVGCDIEKIRCEAYEKNIKLAQRFFTSVEVDRLLSESDPVRRNNRFYQLWTMKESFIKATGAGLSLPLNQFEVVSADENGLFAVHSENYPTHYCRSFMTIPGYACAVCQKDPLLPDKIEIPSLI